MSYLLLTASQNTALGNTIITLVAFVILLLIIKKVAWGPLMNILEDRRATVNADLDKASTERATAQEANLEAQKNLKEAKSEASQIVLQAKQQSLQIQDNMMEEAKAEVLQMQTTARADIERERQQVMANVKTDITNIAIEIAEKIIQREINPADHQHLIEDFIQEMDDLS
ncbi:F0F1 ATP synthase subunit B [Fundicoccus culcitae]|uniref:ATP synthase subunit b n=1 Tax=Fundicoccus culcitae TaxID=2969821 RepID=A0ABY5P609_9LACT|nr:F0F1 ATP synthase subunit B [Fundicoccus culcitae]UUX33989.1 F0F1 ATP synthase subunit B [Fundicoccus culcitae]